MHCDDVLFVKFSECEDSFTFPISLTPNTDYAYLLTDKFGNKYKDTFTSNSDGSLTINKSDFQDFTFTSASGNFTLSIKEHMNSCNNIKFVYCDAEFESITFSFSKNHLNLMPTCEIIRTCLGISDAGSESSFLNEKGEFKTYQEILSNLPSYSIQQDAVDDGKPNGFWYYNTSNNCISKIRLDITNYSFGSSVIDFVSDGSNGWDVTALLEPTSFTNVPDGLTVDSTHFDIEFWSGGVMTTIYDNTISADQTENTGANGAGVYYVAVTYNFSDGTAFVVYGYYLVNATNTILKSVVVGGVTVNSVSGLVMDIAASVVQTNCAVPYAWIGVKLDNSFYVLGSGDSGTFTLEPNTTKILFLPLLEGDTDFSDYDGDPTAIQTIIIS